MVVFLELQVSIDQISYTLGKLGMLSPFRQKSFPGKL